MGKQFDQLQQEHITFIAEQHIYFTGTAAATGKVNISPKGMDSLRVLSPNRILWRNLTGSGNETDGHLKRVNRITLMWCSFTTRPIILRAYGTATSTHVDDAGWGDLNAHFPEDIGARQIFDVTIDLVQSSCGYGVPFFTFDQDRPAMEKWTQDKGVNGVRDYWTERNSQTIDGFPTEFSQ